MKGWNTLKSKKRIKDKDSICWRVEPMMLKDGCVLLLQWALVNWGERYWNNKNRKKEKTENKKWNEKDKNSLYFVE